MCHMTCPLAYIYTNSARVAAIERLQQCSSMLLLSLLSYSAEYAHDSANTVLCPTYVLCLGSSAYASLEGSRRSEPRCFHSAIAHKAMYCTKDLVPNTEARLCNVVHSTCGTVVRARLYGALVLVSQPNVKTSRLPYSMYVVYTHGLAEMCRQCWL